MMTGWLSTLLFFKYPSYALKLICETHFYIKKNVYIYNKCVHMYIWKNIISLHDDTLKIMKITSFSDAQNIIFNWKLHEYHSFFVYRVTVMFRIAWLCISKNAFRVILFLLMAVTFGAPHNAYLIRYLI